MKRRIALIVIAIATLALAVATVVWGDGEFRRYMPATVPPRVVSRPDWVRVLYHPYQRFQNAWFWIRVVATAGAWATVALDGRKGLARPGTAVVTVAFLFICLKSAHFLLAVPTIYRPFGTTVGLHHALAFQVPGAILGAWAVTWGRKPDWRGRIITGMWASGFVLLFTHGILFG